MHASIDQLLSLRDAGPVDATAAGHVDDCAECQAALERLRGIRSRLRALPDPQLPKGPWQQAVAGRDARRRKTFAAAGLAAALALALGLPALFRSDPPPADIVPPLAQNQHPDTPLLMERSRQLETYLNRMPPRPAVMRVGTSDTISRIHDSLALVDYQLNAAQPATLSAEEARRLWQDRVALMNALVQVRQAEYRRAYGD